MRFLPARSCHLSLIGIAVLPVWAVAQPPAARPSIDSIFTRWIAPAAPGCAVGVYERDRVIYSQGYGLASVEHNVRITPQTVFRIGGVSKQFTALAIVLLAQDGKLSLDDPARKHIAEIPDFGGPLVTIRHLLNQTSGVREFYALKFLTGQIERDVVSTARNLAYLRHQETLNFPAGTRFSYANINYTLLGEIVRRVSGQALPQFARERIFEPLGMTHTAYLGPFAVVPHHATAYGAVGAGWETAEPPEADHGPGSVNTSVEDLVRWNENMISHQVGGDSGWAMMIQRGRLTNGNSIPYGFALLHLTFRGQRIVGHQTNFWGYKSAILHFPAFGGGIAVLCNREPPGTPRDLAFAVAAAAWPAQFTAEGAPPAPRVRIPLAPFAGVYFDSTSHMLHQLTISGDTVRGDRLGPLRLVGPDTYESNAGFTVQPLPPTTSGGPVRMIVTNTRSPYRTTDTLTRSGAPWRPARADLVQYTGKYYSTEFDAMISIATVGDDTNGWGLLLTSPYGGPSPFRLGTAQKDLFTMLAPGGNMRFLRDSAGRITQVEVNAIEGTVGVLLRPIR